MPRPVRCFLALLVALAVGTGAWTDLRAEAPAQTCCPCEADVPADRGDCCPPAAPPICPTRLPSPASTLAPGAREAVAPQELGRVDAGRTAFERLLGHPGSRAAAAGPLPAPRPRAVDTGPCRQAALSVFRI